MRAPAALIASALLVWPLASPLGMGCAHSEDAKTTVPPGPPIETEVEVTGLKKEERDVLQEQVCALPQVSSCKLTVQAAKKKKKKKGKRRRGKKAAVDDIDNPTVPRRSKLTFTYGGTLPELRAALASLPHPGLKVQTATVRLTYQGFDNIAPEVTVRSPDDGSAHTVSSVTVVIEVPAADVAEVTIDGEAAKRVEAGVYQRKLKLTDGDHVIVGKASDKTGNVSSAEVSLLVDTTPPALQVKVLKQANDRVVLSGEVEDAAKVTIDGVEVPILSFGKFSKNLPADPDKTSAEVVATDEHGNASTLSPQLVDGWAGAAGPGTPES